MTTNRIDYSSILQLLKAYSVSFPVLVVTPDTKDGAVTPVYIKECIRMYLRTSELASTEVFPTVAQKNPNRLKLCQGVVREHSD